MEAGLGCKRQFRCQGNRADWAHHFGSIWTTGGSCVEGESICGGCWDKTPGTPPSAKRNRRPLSVRSGRGKTWGSVSLSFCPSPPSCLLPSPVVCRLEGTEMVLKQFVKLNTGAKMPVLGFGASPISKFIVVIVIFAP